MFYNRKSYCRWRANNYNNWYKILCSLSTQDNDKLLEQLKSGFKRTINWNKFEPKVTVQEQNQYLDFLINPSFQGANALFVLSFENNGARISYRRYYLPLVQIKNYNGVIDGRNVFHQPVKNNSTTYDNIGKIATGHGDNFTAGCLLDYNHFNNYYKMIAINLNKQQNIWCWSKSNTAYQFYCKSRSRWKHSNVSHYWRSKRNHFRFFTRNVKLLWMCSIILFCFNMSI